MLSNTVLKTNTSTCLIPNISTSTSCLLPLLLLFRMNSTLSIIANTNAQNSIITPSTTIIIEISMVNVIIPSTVVNTGIHR